MPTFGSLSLNGTFTLAGRDRSCYRHHEKCCVTYAPEGQFT